MRCLKCGSENPDSASICMNCGNTLAVNSRDLDEKVERAENLVNRGYFEEALEVMDEILEIDGENPNFLFMKGSLLAILNRLEEAVQVYDKGLEIYPYAEMIWQDRGVHLASLGRFEEAIESYDKAIELNPKYENALFNKGNTLRTLRRFDEAVSCYDEILKFNPESIEVLYNKGYAYFESERYLDAIDIFDEVLALDNEHDDAWYNKGESLRELGRLSEAADSYKEVLRIDSQDVLALINVGVCLGDSEHYEEAIPYFEKALKIDPTRYGVWAQLGLSYENSNHFEEAIEAYGKYLEYESDNEIIQQRLSIVLSSKLHGFIDESLSREFKGLGFYFKAPSDFKMFESNLELDNGRSVPKYELHDEKGRNCLNITYSLSGYGSQIESGDVLNFLKQNGFRDAEKSRIGNLDGFAAVGSNSKIAVAFFEGSDYAYVIDYRDDMLFEYLKESFRFNQVDFSSK